jgi:acyl carrier protein
MSTEDVVADVRSEVTGCFRQVAEEQGVRLAPLEDSLALFESGLDSLCFAIVVVRLEMALGVDPFSTSRDGRFPVTFGEFVAFYEDAAG